MQVTAVPTAAPSPAATPEGPAPQANVPVPDTGIRQEVIFGPWANPAAAAALTISGRMLEQVQRGIEANFDSISRVRAFSGNLVTSNSMFEDAAEALATDGNDLSSQFIPLIERASGHVTGVASRLQAKDIIDTWRDEREHLLDTVRSAALIANTLAEQLDPRR